MKFCTACGHELGVGRFCTNCGTPLPPEADDNRTDTAERPAVRDTPPTPAPSTAAPTPAATTPAAPRSDDYSGRYPLFADESPAAAGSGTAVQPVFDASQQTSETDVLPWTVMEPLGRSPWPVFVTVGVVLALAVALGIWLLGSGDGEPTSTPSGNTPGKQSGSPDHHVTAPKNPTNLARTATASAPVTAPPNQDLSGDVVRYVAANMLDGVPSTAWRMPGDGTDRTLTFTLPSASVLTRVGLINGYAKVDRRGKGPAINWYSRNRRVTKVEWIFDDGTTVTQSLDKTRRMQTLAIDPVETTTVKLRLLSVSAPGARDGRNYTPISDIALVGG